MDNISSSNKKLVGLAGYMGAGKSTCASYLKSKNAYIIDADLEAKQMMLSNLEIKNTLIKTFGSYIIVDEKLNFNRLGKLAFNSIDDLKQLNSIVHPPLIQMLESKITQLINTKTEYYDLVALDAALLPMWKFPLKFDLLIWVDSSYQYRFQRLNAKLFDKLSAQEIEQRMRFQQILFEAPKTSPWVTVYNNSTIEDLIIEFSAILP